VRTGGIPDTPARNIWLVFLDLFIGELPRDGSLDFASNPIVRRESDIFCKLGYPMIIPIAGGALKSHVTRTNRTSGGPGAPSAWLREVIETGPTRRESWNHHTSETSHIWTTPPGGGIGIVSPLISPLFPGIVSPYFPKTRPGPTAGNCANIKCSANSIRQIKDIRMRVWVSLERRGEPPQEGSFEAGPDGVDSFQIVCRERLGYTR